MTDAAAILASLDRFIGQLAPHAELMSGHRVATQIGPMATTNPLTKQVTNHAYHSGHAEQETLVGADHEGWDSSSCPAEDSNSGLARQVSSVGGYSGKSGKSLLIQEFAGNHRQNADGHGGKSPSDQQLASGLKGTRDQVEPELATPRDARRLDPTIWSDLYEERAAHRQFEGGYPHLDAELLAWREVDGAGIWSTASGSQPRYVRDAVSSFEQTTPLTVLNRATRIQRPLAVRCCGNSRNKPRGPVLT
jgi:hypothetical protein